MSIQRIFLPLVAVCAVAGCAPPSFDAVAAQQQLLQRDAEWAEVASKGRDVEKTVSYWSDDAMIVPQGLPIVEGKPAIRAFVASNFQTPGFTIHWKSEKPTFSSDGTMAYMRSASTITVPGPDGSILSLPGRGISIWRLEADGQWRCTLDIWNDPAPATVAAK